MAKMKRKIIAKESSKRRAKDTSKSKSLPKTKIKKPVNLKPKLMVTYGCRGCGMDFARMEGEKAKCFYCNRTSGFTVMKRELITPQVIAARLGLIADRMMDNLKKAMAAPPAEIGEVAAIETLAKAKHLRDSIKKLKLTKKTKRTKKK